MENELAFRGEVVKLSKVNKNYFIELDNGMKLSGWLNKMPEDLKEGDKVSGLYVQNGKYNNITNLMVVPSGFDAPVEEVLDAPAKSPKSNSLKVEVIESDQPIGFQAQLNLFGSTHKVEFTQTHVVALNTASMSKLVYSAVIWYRDL